MCLLGELNGRSKNKVKQGRHDKRAGEQTRHDSGREVNYQNDIHTIKTVRGAQISGKRTIEGNVKMQRLRKHVNYCQV